MGLPVPGLGDAGALTRLMGAGRLAGPIEALALALFAPFNPPGAGDGDGLVDGGRKEDIVLVDGDQKSEFAIRKNELFKKWVLRRFWSCVWLDWRRKCCILQKKCGCGWLEGYSNIGG